ncbi:MAG: aldehyde dehydrogenase family protein [Deltaproteobacteria bacterium]|nr:MAG: aldehyde dehydrogenase family protein [Deltaproteobacteria bacterium]
MIKTEILESLGLREKNYSTSTGTQWLDGSGEWIDSLSPIDGKIIASVQFTDEAGYEKVISSAMANKGAWASLPAPKRGDIVRQIGNKLREKKEALGSLVSLEMGKSLQEGLGEVQEMIDICDFAVGLSRQLYGLTMHSERPNHRMYEQWHPVGLVGIISAFNFPVAVWSWNSMIAAVCGDMSIWKPSEKTPLTGIACFNIMKQVLKDNNVPEGTFNLILGDGRGIGEKLINDSRIPLISATGSTRMGKRVGEVVGSRLGKSILELGGNNAIILTPDADLEMALPAIVFGAVGTCGQRCTSTRRLLIHESLFDKVKETIVKAYKGLKIGSPLDQSNHVGPLIDKDSVTNMQNALASLQKEGGEILYGGEVLDGPGFESGCYVRPAVCVGTNDMNIIQEETFAPILYLIKWSGDVSDAIALQNNVRQGLSSSIFTTNLREAELFLSQGGSDCGIANVNIGTSGAEIGGAFGGEKETGGGRESGSDAWKAYMRRQTNTINYGKDLPLAQGIVFDLG